jgi:hypothetical protein
MANPLLTKAMLLMGTSDVALSDILTKYIAYEII